MIKADTSPSLTTQPSGETFESCINRQYINGDSRERLSKANVLMVPNEGYAEKKDLLYFPSGTIELFNFINERKPEELLVDICIEERDYKEVSQHADWLIIATFVVKEIVAPLFVALLAEYIIQQLGKRRDKTNVKSKLIIKSDNEERYIEYSYEAPANEYREVMLKALTKQDDSNPALPKDIKPKRRRHHKRKRS